VNPERWGVLGGVFDPVHYAHLAIAEQVRDALDLDRVLFVPSRKPVHRPPAQASIADRLRMLELAIAGNPRFELSRIEADSDGPGYSVDTLEQLTSARPWNSYVFIMSSEAAVALPEWHEPRRLIELAEVAIVPRLGYASIPLEWLQGHFPGQVERFHIVATSLLGHSASDIRARLRAGRSIRYLVPDAVEKYIREHDLYRADDQPAA
jgi:nicotinate-nucleotide adenylyltransferase